MKKGFKGPGVQAKDAEVGPLVSPNAERLTPNVFTALPKPYTLNLTPVFLF
jgi:hypothetical protein